MKSKIAVIGASVVLGCLASTAFAADKPASTAKQKVAPTQTTKQKVIAQVSDASEVNRMIESNPNTQTIPKNDVERARIAAMLKMLDDQKKNQKKK